MMMSGALRTFECRESYGGESHSYQGRPQHHEQQTRVVRGKNGPPGPRGQQGAVGPKGEEGKSCDTEEMYRLQEAVKALQGGLQDLINAAADDVMALQDLTNQFTANKKRLQHDVQVLTEKLKCKRF